jgi:ABC-type microcin C transport system duplicated ATPase subunit YejF
VPEPVLSIRDLVVEFVTEDGVVQAVDGITYDLYPGETLGIVGESGSGKSVSTMSLLGLIPQPPGRIVRGEAMFQGKDLLKLSKRELRRIRGTRDYLRARIARELRDAPGVIAMRMRIENPADIRRIETGFAHVVENHRRGLRQTAVNQDEALLVHDQHRRQPLGADVPGVLRKRIGLDARGPFGAV